MKSPNNNSFDNLSFFDKKLYFDYKVKCVFNNLIICDPRVAGIKNMFTFTVQ